MTPEVDSYILQMLNKFDTGEIELPKNLGRFIAEIVDKVFLNQGVSQDEKQHILDGLTSLVNRLEVIDTQPDDSKHLQLVEKNKKQAEISLPQNRLAVAIQLGILYEVDGISFAHYLLSDYFHAMSLATKPDCYLPPPLATPRLWHIEYWWEDTPYDGAVLMLPDLYENPIQEMRWIIKQNPVIGYDALTNSQVIIDEDTKALFLHVICNKIEDIFLIKSSIKGSNNRNKVLWNSKATMKRMADILESLDLVGETKERLHSIIDRQVVPLFQPTFRKLLDSNLLEWRHVVSLFWQGYGMANYCFDPDEWAEFDPTTRKKTFDVVGGIGVDVRSR